MGGTVVIVFLFLLLGLGPVAHATESRWTPRQRPSFYVNLLAFGGVLSEDTDNRLTARDSKHLEGAGGIFRAGATVGDHQLVGGRAQAYIRSSRRVLNEAGMVTDDCWGLVIHGFVGPEYRYVTDSGLYVGAAVGAGLAMGLDDVEDDHWDTHTTSHQRSGDKNTTDEHWALGLSAMASLGHEIRTTRYFALFIELFGGFSQGLDEHDTAMSNGIVGMAFGLGI